MTVYYTKICIHCRNFLNLYRLRGLDWELVDITENTDNLKAFLHLRDTDPAFAPRREAGGIGIPCFVEGGRLTLDQDEALAWKGLGPALPEELPEHR